VEKYRIKGVFKEKPTTNNLNRLKDLNSELKCSSGSEIFLPFIPGNKSLNIGKQ
jgi:hypothetical protein